MSATKTETGRPEALRLSQSGRLAISPNKYNGLSPEWRSMWNEHGSFMVRADEVTIEEYRVDPAKYSFTYPTCQGKVFHCLLQTKPNNIRIIGPDVFHVADYQIPVTRPAGEITVRVYSPRGSGPFPVHLNFHGGKDMAFFSRL